MKTPLMTASEHKFRAVVENSHDGILFADPNCTIFYRSPSCARINGYTDDERLGHSGFDLVHPDDLAAVRRMWAEVVGQPGAIRDLSYRIRHRDGTWLWMETSNQNLLDNPDIHAVLITLRDVTERKRAEEALQASEEKFRLIASSTPDHVLAQDRDLRYTFVLNPQLGLTETDMIGKTDRDILQAAAAEKLSAIKQNVLETGRPFHLQTSLPNRQGSIEHFEGTYVPRYDAAGRVDGLIGYFRNVTERKRVEEAWRNTERRLKHAEEVTHLGHYEIDLRTGRAIWSDETFRIFGLDPDRDEAPTADGYGRYVHPEDRARVFEMYGRSVGEGRPFDLVYRILRADEAVRYVHSIGLVDPDERGEPAKMFGTFQDITERKRAEEAMRDNNAHLQAIHDSIPIMTFLLDRDRNVLFANRGAREFIGGAGPESVLGGRACGVLGCICALDDPRGCGFGTDCPNCSLRLAVEHTFQTGQARHNVERRLRLRGDGQDREVDLLGSTAPVHTSGRDCVLLCLNDVTAHRRADEALRSARQFTDDLIETANSIVVGLDASGNVTIFNRAAERVTGYARSELAGRNWFEVLVPRERYPQVWAEFNRLLAGGMPRNFENPILTRSGEERHILWQNTEVREAGRVIGSVSFGLDITDRKAAEEAIRESEERFRVLVESAPEAIFVQSEGRFVYLNPPMLSLLGASRPEQLIGSEFLDRVAPEFHEAIRERIRFQIATGRSAPPMEQDYIRLDGTRVPVETAAVAIRYQGRDAHLVFVRDMSERKRAEEERALAERRLSLHVQQTPLAVIEFALDGTVREWNPAAERIFGYSRAEAVGQHWTFIVPCSIWNRLDGTWDQIVTQRGGGRSSNENVTKAGGIIQCEWFNTPLTTASGKTIGVASLIMEVTEQRQNEAILQSRLRLVEFAESHSLRDLLRKTLDEVEALTGSSVGFLHFFEADKQWLSLGVWSTRTVTESCRAARDAMHYPLTQAGAWADCVRQGGPVVCNDYRGMADRKGTPPGHADIVRFVSVPVFRGRAIKAVLGVGNKASNYDDRDVAVISRFADFAWDIAERRRSEDERAIALRLLRAASVPGSLHDLARDVLEILREWSGCEAVGLRLRDGDDYPYCETAGFAEGFVRAENHLCVRDAATAVVRDSSGNPVLECMCGNVLCGRFDPNRPFFTEGGSFWTGSTSELLTSTTEADRQARTRNRCHGEGFESVALVPLRVAGQTLGLLQFNDRRRGRVTRQMVSDAERLAARLAISLAQRQTADALQKSEEQLRLALRAGDLGIWEWDLVTGQVVCSERLAQLHGLTDLRGPFETFASRVHPDDLPGLLTAVDRARRTRSYYTHEYRVVWPDGSVHWLRGRGGCEYDGDGNPLKMRGVTVDNTEWRRAQAFLVSSEKMASVGRLAAGLAHEINNPLAGMLQNAQVVLNRVSDGSPANEQIAREAGTSLSAVREYLERRGVPEMLRAIRASGQRAAEIVANMLSFSRKSDEQLVPRDMRELLDRTFDLACAEYDPRYSLDLRAIDVVREYEPGLPPVPCVASEIQQVLLNLFRNAAQAMRERGQRPDPPRLVLRARRQNDTVAIEVEDNGPGMTEEVRHHVFEPFHTTKGPREGTGLGLFVSYAIITRNHHGSITVDTAPGRGTTFTIVLPLNSGGAV